MGIVAERDGPVLIEALSTPLNDDNACESGLLKVDERVEDANRAMFISASAVATVVGLMDELIFVFTAIRECLE